MCFARGAAMMRQKDIKRLSLILLFAPFALWIMLLIILPHIGMVILSLREKVAPRVYEFGFGNYIDFINEPIYWNTLLRTGSMSLLVTALALLIGFPIAYYIAKIAGNRTRGGLFLLCLIPLWVSDLIRAFGWILLLRETGVISTFLQWTGADRRTDRVSLQRRRRDRRPRLHGDPVHDRAAGLHPRRHGQFHDRGRLQSRRQRLHGSAPDHCSLRHAGHRRRLHRGVHADRRLLPDADPARRQEFELVHGADLQPVHHPLQLGGGAAFGMLLLLFTSLVIWLGLKLSGQTLANTVAKS
jgi:hypothetical protein